MSWLSPIRFESIDRSTGRLGANDNGSETAFGELAARLRADVRYIGYASYVGPKCDELVNKSDSGRLCKKFEIQACESRKKPFIHL